MASLYLGSILVAGTKSTPLFTHINEYVCIIIWLSEIVIVQYTVCMYVHNYVTLQPSTAEKEVTTESSWS